MPANVGALPDTDAKLLQWLLNFKSYITPTPATYGLSAAQVSDFTTLLDTFQTASAASEPGMRNKFSTDNKNVARAAVKKSAKDLSFIISGIPSVTNAMRYQLGLNVRAEPQPIVRPTSSPLTEIVQVSGNEVTLRFKSTMTIGKRGRPAGVAGIQIYSFVGSEAPADPAAWQFEGTTTKTLMTVRFPQTVAPGSQVWFTASWMNPRMETGPAAVPVSCHTQFGNTLVALQQQPKSRRRAA